MCSAYKVNNNARPNDIADGEMSSKNNYGSPRVFVKDLAKDGMTASEFKTAVSGQMLCYELATPQTYQLTPQEIQLLLGTNNVWSDGNVTLVYSADIQRWVEKKLNGNSTTLTMSRPMTAELIETETEETE